MANFSEIQKQINQLLESLSAEEFPPVKQLLKANLRACFNGRLIDEDPEPRSSRLGGSPFLPFEIEHPREKRGTAMRFVLQVNFAELQKLTDRSMPDLVLALFGNSDNDYSNAKDKNAFRCVQIANPSDKTFMPSSFPEASISSSSKGIIFTAGWALPRYENDWKNTQGIAPEIIRRLSEIANSENRADIQIFGHSLTASAKELREIAAFAANGVSWSEARSMDSCFSHLVENSHHWLPLIQVKDSFMPDKMLALLITEESLAQGELDKSWLLFV